MFYLETTDMKQLMRDLFTFAFWWKDSQEYDVLQKDFLREEKLTRLKSSLT